MTERLSLDSEDSATLFPRVGRRLLGELEDLHGAIAPDPPENEVTTALGEEAGESERQAFRQGHQVGWQKGAIAFGCAILAGLTVLALTMTGDRDK